MELNKEFLKEGEKKKEIQMAEKHFFVDVSIGVGGKILRAKRSRSWL